MNYRATARPLGFILWLLAVSMLFPLLFAVAHWRVNPGETLGFVSAIVVALALGSLLWLAGRKDRKSVV